MKKSLLTSIVFLSALAFGLGIINHSRANNETSNETIANLEAMGLNDDTPTPTDPSEPVCKYNRETEACKFKVDKGLSNKWVNGILVGEGGIVEIFNGVVICSAEGNMSCKPIECIEYVKLFANTTPGTPTNP